MKKIQTGSNIFVFKLKNKQKKNQAAGFATCLISSAVAAASRQPEHHPPTPLCVQSAHLLWRWADTPCTHPSPFLASYQGGRLCSSAEGGSTAAGPFFCPRRVCTCRHVAPFTFICQGLVLPPPSKRTLPPLGSLTLDREDVVTREVKATCEQTLLFFLTLFVNSSLRLD